MLTFELNFHAMLWRLLGFVHEWKGLVTEAHLQTKDAFFALCLPK